MPSQTPLNTNTTVSGDAEARASVANAPQFPISTVPFASLQGRAHATASGKALINVGASANTHFQDLLFPAYQFIIGHTLIVDWTLTGTASVVDHSNTNLDSPFSVLANGTLLGSCLLHAAGICTATFTATRNGSGRLFLSADLIVDAGASGDSNLDGGEA